MTSFGVNMTGTLVGTTAPFNLALPPGYDDIEMFNVTDLGSATTTSVMTATGTSAMPAGGAYYSVGSGANSTLTELFTPTGGFTFVPDSGHYPLGPSVAVTAITAANPAVVSATTTGLIAGQSVVTIYNETNMQQISGMDFTIGTISAGTSFQLKYLDASGFAAAGTAGSYRIVPFPYSYFYPRRKFITKITQATQAVITLSVTHQYAVGEYLRVIVPNGFGMTQMNGLQGLITAVDTTNNTVTVNIDSTAFTAFAFPASAGVPVTFAQTVDIAEQATILTQAEVNNSWTGVQIGATVMTSGKTYQWVAHKGANFGLQVSL